MVKPVKVISATYLYLSIVLRLAETGDVYLLSNCMLDGRTIGKVRVDFGRLALQILKDKIFKQRGWTT